MAASEAETRKRLFVGGLAKDVTENELKKKFELFLTVSNISLKIQNDGEGNHFKTFAHLDVHGTESGFKKCYNAYQNAKWKGNVMKLEDAKPSFLDRLAIERQEGGNKDVSGNGKSKKKVGEWIPPELDKLKVAPVPGTPVPGKKDWVVGKYGRVLPVLNVKKSHLTKPMKHDPSKFCHTSKIFKEDNSNETGVDCEALTWEIDEPDSEMTKKRKGEFPPDPKPKKTKPFPAELLNPPVKETVVKKSLATDKITSSKTSTFKKNIAKKTLPTKSASNHLENSDGGDDGLEIVTLGGSSQNKDKPAVRSRFDSDYESDGDDRLPKSNEVNDSKTKSSSAKLSKKETGNAKKSSAISNTKGKQSKKTMTVDSSSSSENEESDVETNIAAFKGIGSLITKPGDAHQNKKNLKENDKLTKAKKTVCNGTVGVDSGEMNGAGEVQSISKKKGKRKLETDSSSSLMQVKKAKDEKSVLKSNPISTLKKNSSQYTDLVLSEFVAQAPKRNQQRQNYDPYDSDLDSNNFELVAKKLAKKAGVNTAKEKTNKSKPSDSDHYTAMNENMTEEERASGLQNLMFSLAGGYTVKKKTKIVTESNIAAPPSAKTVCFDSEDEVKECNRKNKKNPSPSKKTVINSHVENEDDSNDEDREEEEESSDEMVEDERDIANKKAMIDAQSKKIKNDVGDSSSDEDDSDESNDCDSDNEVDDNVKKDMKVEESDEDEGDSSEEESSSNAEGVEDNKNKDNKAMNGLQAKKDKVKESSDEEEESEDDSSDDEESSEEEEVEDNKTKAVTGLQVKRGTVKENSEEEESSSDEEKIGSKSKGETSKKDKRGVQVKKDTIEESSDEDEDSTDDEESSSDEEGEDNKSKDDKAMNRLGVKKATVEESSEEEESSSDEEKIESKKNKGESSKGKRGVQAKKDEVEESNDNDEESSDDEEDSSASGDEDIKNTDESDDEEESDDENEENMTAEKDEKESVKDDEDHVEEDTIPEISLEDEKKRALQVLENVVGKTKVDNLTAKLKRNNVQIMDMNQRRFDPTKLKSPQASKKESAIGKKAVVATPALKATIKTPVMKTPMPTPSPTIKAITATPDKSIKKKDKEVLGQKQTPTPKVKTVNNKVQKTEKKQKESIPTDSVAESTSKSEVMMSHSLMTMLKTEAHEGGDDKGNDGDTSFSLLGLFGGHEEEPMETDSQPSVKPLSNLPTTPRLKFKTANNESTAPYEKEGKNNWGMKDDDSKNINRGKKNASSSVEDSLKGAGRVDVRFSKKVWEERNIQIRQNLLKVCKNRNSYAVRKRWIEDEREKGKTTRKLGSWIKK